MVKWSLNNECYGGKKFTLHIASGPEHAFISLQMQLEQASCCVLLKGAFIPQKD